MFFLQHVLLSSLFFGYCPRGILTEYRAEKCSSWSWHLPQFFFYLRKSCFFLAGCLFRGGNKKNFFLSLSLFLSNFYWQHTVEMLMNLLMIVMKQHILVASRTEEVRFIQFLRNVLWGLSLFLWWKLFLSTCQNQHKVNCFFEKAW